MPTREWLVLRWLRSWPDLLGLVGVCAIGYGLWLVTPGLVWVAAGAFAILAAVRLSPPSGSSS